jgi:hypothetical protein
MNFHFFNRKAFLSAALITGLCVLTTFAVAQGSGEEFTLASKNPSRTTSPTIRTDPEHSHNNHLIDDVIPKLNFKHSTTSNGKVKNLDENDSDGDGLPDDDEVALGTNPFRMDSDCDGILDFDEVNVVNGVFSIKDSDDDGIVDGMESSLIDSDKDGIRDNYDPETEFQVVCGKFEPFVITKSETSTFTVTAVTPGISRLVINPGLDDLELYDDGTHGDVQIEDRVFTRSGFGLADPGSVGYLAISELGIQTEKGFVKVGTRDLFNRMLWIWLVEDEDLVTEFLQIDELFVTQYAAAIVDPELAALVWAGQISDAAKRFIDLLGSDFDFIEILPDGAGAPYYSGYHIPLMNQVEGIGLSIFDNRGSLGLKPFSGRLLGIQWQNNSGPSLGGATTHEVMHQWQAYAGSELGFRQCEGSHWGVLGQGRGVMGGYDPETVTETSPGVYEVDYFSACCGVGQPYTPLELYVAGLIPPNEVLPIQVPRNVDCGSLRCNYPKCTFEAEGMDTVTIDELIALEGPRLPAFGEAQAHFKIAHVLVTDTPPTLAELSYIDMKGRYIDNPDNKGSFSQVSGGRGSTDSTILATHINEGHSGAWFNPETSGQGQFIDIEPEEQFIFISWFTYTDSASEHPNEQQWYTAQGNYSGNTARLDLFESLGGHFNDPVEVTTAKVGEVTLTFDDCGHGNMTYSFDEEALQGEFPLLRVVPNSGHICEQSSRITTQAVGINAGMDGAWFDPVTSGQGYFMDAHPDPEGGNIIFVSWFTYGDETASGQRWLTAQGSFEGSSAEIDVWETTGGSFDDPEPVDRTKVGTMSLDFTDCSNAQLSYSLPADPAEGDIAITRVIPGSQALCEELVGAE